MLSSFFGQPQLKVPHRRGRGEGGRDARKTERESETAFWHSFEQSATVKKEWLRRLKEEGPKQKKEKKAE